MTTIRVLYVDDEPDLLDLGKIYLEMNGEFFVETAERGSAALEILKARPFDAVISDYQMPEMDGISLLKEVRALFGSLPFVLFTGRGREEIVIEAINHGADFYLQKGGDPTAQFAELSHKIRQAVARHHTETELSSVHLEMRKKLEEETQVSDFSRFLLSAATVEEVLDSFGDRIHLISGADYLMLSRFDPADQSIGIHSFRGLGPFLSQLGTIIRAPPQSLKVPMDYISAHAEILPLGPGLKRVEGGIFTLSRGYLPRAACSAIEIILGVSSIYIYELVREGILYGSVTFGFREGREIQNPSLITLMSNLLANGLWRIYSADAIAAERQSLAKSESRFRGLTENSLDAIMLFGRDLRHIYVNPTVMQQSGIPAEQFIGKTHEEMGFPPELVRTWNERLSRVFETGRTDRCEFQLPNGTWIDWMLVPVKDETGRVLQAITSARDITDRRRAEEQIRLAEFSLENSGIATYWLDREARVVRTNRAACESLGYTRDEMVRLTVPDFDPRFTKETWPEIWERIVAEKYVVIESLHKRKDGTVFPVEIASSYFEYGGRELIFSFARDISSQKHAEAEIRQAYDQIAASEEELRANYDTLALNEQRIRESEALFRGLFDQAFQLTALLDTNGTVLQANNEALSLIGTGPGDVTGIPFPETPWLAHNPAMQEKMRSAISRAALGETLRFEVTITDPAGTIRSLDFSIKPITDHTGKIIALLPEARDITDLKEAQRGVQESRDLFRAFIDHSYDALFIHDLQGNLTDVNTTMLEMYRVSRDEALRHTIADYTGPKSSMEEAGRHWEQVIAGNDQFFPWQARRPGDGSVFDVEVYLTRIDIGDRPLILGNIRDVTEKKRILDALRLAEFSIEHTGIATFWFDHDSRVVRVNDASCRALGYSREELLSMRVQDFDPTISSIAEWEASWNRAKELQVYKTRESVHRRKDGSTFPVEILSSYFTYGEKEYLFSFARDITGRKMAENALRESEETFRSFVRESADGISLLDEEGRIIEWNDALARISGIPRSEAMGAVYTDLILSLMVPEHRTGERMTRFRDAILNACRTGISPFFSRPIEADYVRRDGQRRVIQQTVFPIRTEKGWHIGSISRDITERKEIDLSLQRSEERFRTIAATIPGVLYQFFARRTGEMGMYYVSDRCREIFGIPPDLESFFSRFTACVAPEDRDRFISSIDEAVRSGTRWDFRGRFIREDGKEISFHGLSEPLETGSELIFQGMLLDITAEVRAELALRDEQEFSRLLLDTSPAFVVAIGTDGRTISMNRALLEALEYTAEEVHGADYLSTFVPEEDRTILAGIFRQIVYNGEATVNENRIVSKSGRVFRVEWHGRPVRREGSRPGFFVGIGIDITNRQ